MSKLVCSIMNFWKILNISLLVYSNSGHASDDTETYINSEKKTIDIRQGKKQNLYNFCYSFYYWR